MTNASADVQPSKVLASAARDLLETTIIYLMVVFISGISYVLCTLAWNGGTFVRLWLAAIGPIAVFLVARLAWITGRRLLVRAKHD